MSNDTSQPMQYASFWSRSNAYKIDVIFITLLCILLDWLLIPGAKGDDTSDLAQLMQTIQSIHDGDMTQLRGLLDGLWNDLMLGLAVAGLYNILFIASHYQATPGKRHYGLKVVNTDGSRLTLRQSALRHVASGLSTTLLGLGFFMALFTSERTTLHDMICKTRVIRVKTPAN